MQANPMPGVMNTLKDAGFDEDQRMAMVTAVTEMQYPLLEATERLRSEMKELRSEMDARLRHMAIAVYGLIIPILFIVYQVAPKAG